MLQQTYTGIEDHSLHIPTKYRPFVTCYHVEDKKSVFRGRSPPGDYCEEQEMAVMRPLFSSSIDKD